MAQAIAFEVQPHTEQTRASSGSEPRSEALLSAYELLEVLHDRGVLEMARGVVTACDEGPPLLASTVCSPESVRGIHNVMLLTRFLAGIPPEVLQTLIETVSTGAHRARSEDAPGFGRLLWRLRKRDTRQTLAVMMDLLEAVGKAL